MEAAIYLLWVVLPGAVMGRWTGYIIQRAPGLPRYLSSGELPGRACGSEHEAPGRRGGHGKARCARWAALTRGVWRHRYEASGILALLPVPVGEPADGLLAALWINYLFHCLFNWFLVTLSWIDYYTLRLPDRLTLPFLVCGLLNQITRERGIPTICALADGLLGALCGGGALLLLNGLFRCVKGHDGIGGGDIKLLAGLGAWLGWRVLPELCCGAALAGLAWCWMTRCAVRHRQIAFGPCLALAGWLIYISP